MNRGRDILLACSIFVLLDLAAAQLLRLTPLWGPEVSERRYRVGHPAYHHDLASNVDLTAWWGDIAYPLKTNSLGFRDSAVRTIAPGSDRPRLLLIGDSFTEGLGVDYAETYGALLGQTLAQRGLELLNAGVMSYSPSIYYQKLRYLLEETRLRIDYVVVAIDLSDIPDEAQAYRLDDLGNIVSRPGDLRARARSLLKEYSLLFHVVDRVRDVVRSRLADPARFSDWTTDAEAYDEFGAEGLALAAARMDDLYRLLRGRDIGLAIVVYPYPAQVRRRDGTSKQVRFWAEWSRDRAVPFFELFPAFLTSGPPDKVIRDNFIPHDVHWNARGHRLVADALLRVGLADTVDSHLSRVARLAAPLRSQ